MSINVPYISSTQVAKSTPFDNSTDGFTATNVQAAIEEAQAKPIISHTYVSSTSTVSSTSGTFAIIADMTTTPTAGTWLVTFSASSNTTGVNTIGNFAMYYNSVQITDTVRNIGCTTAILGLITLSTATVNDTTHIQTILTVDGTKTVDIRFNQTSGSGNVVCTDRSIIFIRLGP